MQFLRKEGGKPGIIYTCKLWMAGFGPNWLNCKSFPHGPNSRTERLGLIMRPAPQQGRAEKRESLPHPHSAQR